MNRKFQLLGLLLIGLLSFQAEPASASDHCEENSQGCLFCWHDDGCMTWVCGSYSVGALC